MNTKWKWTLFILIAIAASFLIKNPYYDASHDDKVLTEITVEKAREASVKLREAYKDNSIYLSGIDAPYDKARTEYAHAIGMVNDLEKGERKTKLNKQLKSVEKEIEIANNFNKAVRSGKRLMTAQQKAEAIHIKEPFDIKAAVKAQKELEDAISKLSGIFDEIPFTYVRKDMKVTYVYPAKQFNRDAIFYVEGLALIDEAKQNTLESEKGKYIEQAKVKAKGIKHKELKAKLEKQINDIK
jgi:hypothetical protein